jgi:hypothetical protein
MTFVIGQRVRVCQYNNAPCPEKWGDPHFIVGHFGHIDSFDGNWINVRIDRAPDLGPVTEPRVFDDDDEFGEAGIWPMIAEELEPVD